MTAGSAITSEILRNKFVAVVEDMRATLINTAYSEAVGQAHDCASAILSENGKLIATDSALQMFWFAETTKNVADYFEFDMTAHDVVLTNDPYGGGTRVAEFTLVAPVAHEDLIIMYLAVRARMSDAGGELLGAINPAARELWAEGVRITPVKVVRDGRLQNDVLTTVLLNSRLPEAFRLDLDAMMAAINVGKQRLSDLLQTYGTTAVLRAADWGLEYAARRVAAEISTWPEGDYRGESSLERDGHGRTDICVRVLVKVAKGHLELDFSESDSQSTAFINSTYANTWGYALLPILSVIDPSIPRNSGLADCVSVKTRKGTVVDPKLPAPTGWSHHHVGCEISEAVISALVQFMPERVANVAASMPLASTIAQAARHGGTIEQTGNRDYSRFCQGHCDAAYGRDGWGLPGVFAERPLPSAELYEIETGGRIDRLELVTDSGGAGQWRGGLSSEVVIAFPRGAEALLLSVFLTKPSIQIHRLSGGKRGAESTARLVTGDNIRTIENSILSEPVGAETGLVLQMTGGSGWGPPHKREPQAVLQDVLDGYVSVEKAALEYGVVVKVEAQEIDLDKTRLKRVYPYDAEQQR